MHGQAYPCSILFLSLKSLSTHLFSLLALPSTLVLQTVYLFSSQFFTQFLPKHGHACLSTVVHLLLFTQVKSCFIKHDRAFFMACPSKSVLHEARPCIVSECPGKVMLVQAQPSNFFIFPLVRSCLIKDGQAKKNCCFLYPYILTFSTLYIGFSLFCRIMASHDKRVRSSNDASAQGKHVSPLLEGSLSHHLSWSSSMTDTTCFPHSLGM